MRVDTEMQAMGEIIVEKKAGRRELIELIKAQGYRCAMTGVTLTPDVAELDHINPVSKGGTHSIDNLQVVHAAVNRMRGAMDLSEFIGWCEKVAEQKVRTGCPYSVPPGTN